MLEQGLGFELDRKIGGGEHGGSGRRKAGGPAIAGRAVYLTGRSVTASDESGVDTTIASAERNHGTKPAYKRNPHPSLHYRPTPRPWLQPAEKDMANAEAAGPQFGVPFFERAYGWVLVRVVAMLPVETLLVRFQHVSNTLLALCPEREAGRDSSVLAALRGNRGELQKLVRRDGAGTPGDRGETRHHAD